MHCFDVEVIVGCIDMRGRNKPVKLLFAIRADSLNALDGDICWPTNV